MEELLKSLEEKVSKVSNINELNDIKAEYLGKKGSISALSSNMANLSIEEKKEYGMKLNEIKTKANDLLESKRVEFENAILNEKLSKEAIDISLPATKIASGAPNILEKVIEEVEDLFMSMGYDVVDGPEVEEDK